LPPTGKVLTRGFQQKHRGHLRNYCWGSKSPPDSDVDYLRLALNAFFIKVWDESSFDEVYDAIEKGFITIGIPIDKLTGK
jgi:hypothetical protein